MSILKLNNSIDKIFSLQKTHDVLNTQDLRKIVYSCPGRGFAFDYLSKKIKTKKKSKILGNYNSIYIGSSNSELLRNKASSGGIIRSILMELIKLKEVDFVYILDEKKNKILDFDVLVTNKLNKILNNRITCI